MSMEPLPWIASVNECLAESAQIPLWKKVPSFPWTEFADRLSEALSLSPLTMTCVLSEWRSADQLLTGLGTTPLILGLDLSPLAHAFFWAMSGEDISKLIKRSLSRDKSAQDFSDPSLQQGFFTYLMLHALESADALKALGDLSAKLSSDHTLLHEPAFVLDIRIESEEDVLWGRLICPLSAHRDFNTHYAKTPPSANAAAQSGHLPLTLRLEAGKSTLSLKEWQEVAVGDFIILERCSVDPLLKKGSVEMVLGTIPLFHARLKQHQLKITDYGYYYEDEKMVDDSVPGSKPEEDDISDELEAAPSKEQGEGDPSLEQRIATADIPITLTVEIGRITLTVEKLLQLQPGNLLELSVSADQGVDVTIGGKKVAKAELVKLGDVLGLKILQIGP